MSKSRINIQYNSKYSGLKNTCNALDEGSDGWFFAVLRLDQGRPQLTLEPPVVFDEELVLEDDVEAPLELLVAGGGLGGEEGQDLVHDVGVAVGKVLQSLGQGGLRL